MSSKKSYLDSNHNLVEGKLHAYTPLIESPKLSVLAKKQVLLKLDNLQPSGSFKIRGIGNLVQHGKANGKKLQVFFKKNRNPVMSHKSYFFIVVKS